MIITLLNVMGENVGSRNLGVLTDPTNRFAIDSLWVYTKGQDNQVDSVMTKMDTMPSGVYFYKVDYGSGKLLVTKKMVFLR